MCTFYTRVAEDLSRVPVEAGVAAYIDAHPPEVCDPQQNEVVNGQLESAQAADVSAEERAQVREFADEVLRAEAEGEETDECGGRSAPSTRECRRC